MRSKGDIESFDLGELSGLDELRGVSVHIQHIGPGLHRQWALRGMRIQQDEMLRLVELRRGVSKEECPELWSEDFMTVEAAQAGLEESIRVVEECVSHVSGLGPLEGVKDPKIITEELTRLGVEELVMKKAMEVQALSPPQFPSSTDPRDASGERAPSDDVGSSSSG